MAGPIIHRPESYSLADATADDPIPTHTPHSIGCQSVESSLAPPATLNLFVPHPESSLCTRLAHGSAIVGISQRQDLLRIFYEGNVIGAANLTRYRDRVARAAGRLLHNYPAGYPTVARADVDPREVIAIGTIELASGRLEITARGEDLSWWIDPVDLEDLGVLRGSY